MSLASANVSYPAHVRMHQHQQSQPYTHPHHLDTSPTMSHESLPSKLGNASPSHPLSPMEPSLHHPQHHHHHYHHQQQQQQPSSYHHSQAPYQAPTPPYNPRSNSIDLAQKPTLPYPRRPSHSYAPSHPYSPPTLPPLTNHLPPSPQSPIDSGSLHYPMQSSNRDDRPLSYQHYRSSMSSSPPPSSSGAASATSPSATTASGLPLSATDRRERNKAASAKYRAKKHYQSGEMRQQINVLQDQNNVLTRQLEESRTENASLKHLVEKLRGRLVAEKVLKRLREVGREKKKNSINNSNKRKLNGKSASSLAHLAAVSDSEEDNDHHDHEDDDEDSDLVGDVDVDDDDEEEEDAELQRRQNERKPNTRRRVTRVEDNSDDDDDYLEN